MASRPGEQAAITVARSLDATRPILHDTAVIEAPEVRYVNNDGTSLAYQIVGDGPIDILEMAGFFTHLEVKWESPGLIRSIAGLARFSRLIMFDRRGIGLSDRDPARAGASPDQMASDALAVMDAVGCDSVVALGVADGCSVAATLAARHPDRVRALVLYNTTPLIPHDEMRESFEAMTETALERWGTGVMAEFMGGPEMRSYFARAERRACTPPAAALLLRSASTVDLTELLPTIRTPTLLMHYRDHLGQPVEAARVAADLIPGSQLIEAVGYSPSSQVFERTGLASAVEEFVTGVSSADDSERELAAVLFTDIVASTEHAAELGHRRWRDLLDENEARLRRTIDASAGQVVKTTGDGVLARFDGAARAVRCAQMLIAEASRMGIQLRAGLHVGECDRRDDDIAGITVHVAARVMALAGPGEVYASSTVRQALVGTDIVFESRGTRELRGVPGQWDVFVIGRGSAG